MSFQLTKVILKPKRKRTPYQLLVCIVVCITVEYDARFHFVSLNSHLLLIGIVFICLLYFFVGLAS